MLEWLPWLLAFVAAAMLADGYFARLDQGQGGDPELFALYACAAIVAVCAALLGLVAPVVRCIPLVMPCVPLMVSLLVGRAVPHFHRRG